MKIEIATPEYPFFTLSSHQDLVLFLIGKELQGTKFTGELDRVGFDSSRFCTDLGTAILALMGFQKYNDELWHWYYETLERYAEKVDLWDHSTASEPALEFYLQLCIKLKAET